MLTAEDMPDDNADLASALPTSATPQPAAHSPLTGSASPDWHDPRAESG